MNIKTIRLGADTPNAGNPPYFFGHMRNLRVTGDGGNTITFDRKPPFTGKLPSPVVSIMIDS